jgi:sugar phosphate isomerase/epimerase
MKKGISTHLFVQDRLTVEHLRAVLTQGFESLEIFALKPHFDYRDKKLVAEVASWLSDQPSFLQSLHTPFCLDYQAKGGPKWLSISDSERIGREKAIDEIRRALEFAEKVPIPLAVVHMGAPEDPRGHRQLDAIYYSLETLVPFASARSVKLALENIPNRLSSLEHMRRFLEDAQLKDVGICFDSGHANLQASAATEIRDGGPWIVSTHLHDNHGMKDEHLMPFEGTIDWPAIFEAFGAIQYEGNLILELKAGNGPAIEVLKAARKCFDRFEKCQEALLELKAREG